MSDAGWRNRIVGESEEAADSLLANPHNWRTHPIAQRRALAAVLARVGWVTRVIVNRRTGHVIDGHARILVAMDQEDAMVPVTWVDLGEDEERAVLATLDPLAAMAGTDDVALRTLVSALDADLSALIYGIIDTDGIIDRSLDVAPLDTTDRSKWMTISVDVPPDTYHHFERVVMMMPGQEIHERLAAALDVVLLRGAGR